MERKKNQRSKPYERYNDYFGKRQTHEMIREARDLYKGCKSGRIVEADYILCHLAMVMRGCSNIEAKAREKHL